MKKLIVLRGLPGSGKTTYARELAENNPTTIIRVNSDDIRHMMGQYWIPVREKLIQETINKTIEEALLMEYSVIVDNMNLNDWVFNNLKEIAKVYEAELVVKEFNTPIEECIRRDSLREKPVGEKTIRAIADKNGMIL